MAARPESLGVNYSGAVGDGGAGTYLEFGMTMITVERALLEQVMFALETKGAHHPRVYAAITALKAAPEQPEQDSHWLTKELMADYLDVIAEAVENNNSEILRHKSHWLRAEGDV
jgi:hypothetical protein